VRCLTILACTGGLWLATSAAALPARAQAQCTQLRFAFQPDCFRDAGGKACLQSVERMDLMPQIAVWVESADRTQFIDTLLVTNAVAVRGIGNRPGRWDFLSAPKFPYGKRVMALPIWAYARGKMYDVITMKDESGCDPECESWLGWHEATSSPEMFFCTPFAATGAKSVEAGLMMGETVDAITCPSVFNSSKGKSTTTKTYYPPRNDLNPLSFQNSDCDEQGGVISPAMNDPRSPCRLSARSYATINDLDAVAAATPPYGSVYGGTWKVPANLAAGDYLVMVEVNKEYDTNSAHDHPSFTDPRLAQNGIPGNFGQPSVLYKVPIHIDPGSPSSASTMQIAGYGDWRGLDGAIAPRDATISTTVPGSGEMRLLDISGPGGQGRVHVSVESCAAQVCDPPPSAPTPVGGLTVVEGSQTPFSVDVAFVNASANGATVMAYDIRYRNGATMTADEFAQATKIRVVVPTAPGTPGTFTVRDLKPKSQYSVGIRSIDQCNQQSELVTLQIETKVKRYAQLSGCFIATAAYGSEMEPQVAAMRQMRDRLRSGSALFSAAADLYYRSGPAAAEVLKQSDTARAIVRRVLAPVSAVASAAAKLGP
jgi:hypothetical protein